MRNWLKLIISSVAVFSLLAVTSSSYGVAAFARQTGLECNSCHAAPGFPSLNSFGMAFKAGGYTQGGGPLGSVEGENLNLPAALNLGVVFKARMKTVINGTSSAVDTDLEFPDETAVFAAGRIGDDVGFVIELGDAWYNSFKMVFAPEVGPVRIGIVPWHTDAFGAGWVFETLSTGTVRNIRISEDRNSISAQSATSWGGGGEASGLGLYVWHPMGFVAFTTFSEGIGGHQLLTPGYYARIAVTPSLDFADLAVGFAYKFGENVIVADGDVDRTSNTYNWLAVDAQMMLADLPLTVILTYASDLTDAGVQDHSGESYLTIVVDYLILEGANPLGVNVNYLQDLTTSGTNSVIGGSVKFGVTQNSRVSLDVSYNLGTTDFMLLPMVAGSW